MLQQLLQKLDFDSKETDVYLTILEQGKVSATEIAQITKINRTTVYSVTKELLSKGVITEDLGGKTRYYLANPPSDLYILSEKEEKMVQKKKKTISKAITELERLAKDTRYSIPKINFIDESEIEKYLYKNSAKWNESIMKDDTTWWGFQDHTFVDYFENWIDWYWKESVPKDLQLKLLSNEPKTETRMEKKKYRRRDIRFWKESKKFTATTWVNGDYIIMIITKQHPHYLIEIHDTIMAHNMRELFKGIWKQLK
ncbi:Rrf2 family transcriptional regulator [Patescibacteria group bacterium]|nr:Rrf2 family transcriptional regulator [Patescibacteria group bacterium]